MRLLGVKAAYNLQPLFPITDTKFQVKRRMKGGCVQAEDLYMIIMFLEIIDKNTLEKNYISLLATLLFQ